jgi:predicted secreted protein
MANYAAKGTLLKKGDGGSPTENFTTIAQVTDISGPELKLNTIDATSMDSTNGWKQRIAGLLDGGGVKVEINYDPQGGTHNDSTGLLADMANRTLRNFKITFTDAGPTTWAFAAFVTAFTPKAPVAGKLAASVSLELSGQPTLA